MPEAKTSDCEHHCRSMAQKTFALADEARHPYVIDAYLRIAAHLTACAEATRAGRKYDWPPVGD